MTRTLVSFVLCLALATSAWAGWDEGVAAFERGDYATAMQEWLPLAEQGRADAQFGLGFLYDQGRGVQQDYASAAMWYRKAAEQGHAGAQSSLGVLHHRGQGVPMDFDQAVKWYRKSAEQGNGMALNNLGVMYHRGEGISMDFVLAHKWYNLAAAFGIEQSARNRDDIATRMTPAQIQEALKLSKEWYAAYHRRQKNR